MTPDERYARCEPVIIGYESTAYTNNPKDKGGPTKGGITLAALSEYRGHPCTAQDVMNLSDAERDAIYRKNYWAAVCGDQLPAGVDLFCFDSAVNCGRSHGAKWLQRALCVAEDGSIGPRTLAALAEANPLTVIDKMSDAREAYYRSLDDFSHWGNGWLNRLGKVTKLSLSWADA